MHRTTPKLDQPRFATLRLCALCAAFFFHASSSHAADEVYQRIHKDGTIEFSDVPGEDNTTRIDLEPVPTLTFPKLPTTSNRASQHDQQKPDLTYTEIAITSPAPDTVLRENSGNVTIQATVEPRLQKDHMLILTGNGARLSAPQKGYTFAITNLERGTHTFSVSVVDASGKSLISSPPVSIHLQRTSVLSPARHNKNTK